MDSHVDATSVDHRALVAHRVLHKAARIHELLLVALVEFDKEPCVNSVDIHLLKRVHELLYWEVASVCQEERIGGELPVKVLVSKLRHDLNLQVFNLLTVLLDEGDHVLLGDRVLAPDIENGKKVGQLLIRADFRVELETLSNQTRQFRVREKVAIDGVG